MEYLNVLTFLYGTLPYAFTIVSGAVCMLMTTMNMQLSKMKSERQEVK